MVNEIIEPKAPYALCGECPLQEKSCARSLIPKSPIAAIVSRSPGYHESKIGKPFAGPSGKVLDYLLNEQGVTRDQVLLTNVVLCAPEEGEVPPQAIKACAPRLQAELEGIELVIACGREAVNLIVGRGAIDRYRGYRIQQDGRIAVASNNPALVLRDDSTFPNLRKDFKRAFNPLPPPEYPKVEVIEDIQDAKDYIDSLESCKYISADIESRGGLTHRATIVSMQFSTNGKSAVVLGERRGLWEDSSFIQDCLRPFFESKRHCFIGHNFKFDVKILRHTYGINARIDEDSLLLSYILDERSGQTDKAQGGYHKLEYLLSEEFGWEDYEPKSVKEFKKDGIVRDYDELHEYAGRDAAGTYQLFELLSKRVKEEKLESPYRTLLLGGAEACSRIESVGFLYDVYAAADMMEREVKPELQRLIVSLSDTIDNPLYNPRSPIQTSVIIYDDWRISHAMRARPDKDRSVDIAALNEIIAGRFTNRAGITKGDPEYDRIIKFATELKRFRQLAKQADTYIVGLIEKAIDDPEHRIHTDLLLHGTTTGRLSSRRPNLQNCYAADTEILTLKGWKLFTDLDSNDEVAQWDDGKIEFVLPSEIVIQDYEGDMISVKTETIDLLVTPNHRMLSFTRDDNPRIDESSYYCHWKQGQIVDRKFVRGGQATGKRKLSVEDRLNLERAIAAQAYGHVRSDTPQIELGVTSDRKKKQLREIFPEVRERAFNDAVWIKFTDPCLRWLYLPSKDFRIDKLLELGSEDLDFFIECIHRWDGDYTRKATYLQRNDRLASVEAVQLAAALSGKSTQWYERPEGRHSVINIHRKALRNFSRLWAQKQSYVGKICCVTVPSGFVVVRRNKNIVVSGNTTRTKPNLPDIRSLFLASPGRKIVQSDYCVVPETKVLRTDLTWIDTVELSEGDSLIGFEPTVGTHMGYNTAYLKESIVERTDIIVRPCYRIITDRGELIASDEHPLVGKKRKDRTREWIKTKDLKTGYYLSFYTEPWEVQESYDAGYLSGIFDGEGYISNTTLSFGQNAGPTLDRVLDLLRQFGFNPTYQKASGTTCEVYFLKGYAQSQRFLGMFRPTRLMEKSRSLWDGRRSWGSNSKPAIILDIEYVGEREVVALGTSTKTLITNGFLSHNSQAELRCIAWLSQDAELLRVYNEGLDLHSVTAKNFYGENFTSEQRSRAKNANFGMFYGQSAASFQEKHDIPEKEAARYIEWAKRNFAQVWEFKDEVVRDMRKTGYVESPFGRKRRFHLITKENANALFREAFNFLPQSTAGDFTLRSVIVLQREIDPRHAAILITVHDNIVSDVEESYVDQYKEVCRQIMESRPKEELGWTIPFKVDIGVGDNWGNAK